MTSTVPNGPGTSPARSRRSGWWWWLPGIALLGLVVVLVLQPWSHETEPLLPPTESALSTSPRSSSPTAPTAAPSATPTLPPVPGAEAVFDDSTMRALFVRPRVVEDTVPAAQDGVALRIRSGELAWGLPEGSRVEPERCTAAVTVVTTAPAAFDARAWGNAGLDLTQTLTLLPDAATAAEAFRELVTTVDGCPRYTQVNPGMDGAVWTAEPAIEGQGVYPSIVQEVVHESEGQRTPTFRGHLLVGNVVVSWTAAAPGDGEDLGARLATLGTADSLSMLMQERAQAAVQGLG
ncbi:sensor domain-containing protein [Cellulomonas sp.]|uniref:sensor domain-containing protein n=1 Tax=Cellulomonas sp. TaxID=40001 RepID=UPI00258A045A|nr:sensor domain-containing protein [Cellulomonas sp.]MCR6689379.1 sensor domain-containing protein [Cellulomonas sp.]